MLTDKELREIRERCERASEGPWELHDSCSWRRIGTPGHDGKIFSPFVNRYDGHPDISGLEEDFEFIVNARTDVPKLLDEIAELKVRLAETNGLLQTLRRTHNIDLPSRNPSGETSSAR